MILFLILALKESLIRKVKSTNERHCIVQRTVKIFIKDLKKKFLKSIRKRIFKILKVIDNVS